jgi:hypothetical protein
MIMTTGEEAGSSFNGSRASPGMMMFANMKRLVEFYF